MREFAVLIFSVFEDDGIWIHILIFWCLGINGESEDVDVENGVVEMFSHHFDCTFHWG